MAYVQIVRYMWNLFAFAVLRNFFFVYRVLNVPF